MTSKSQLNNDKSQKSKKSKRKRNKYIIIKAVAVIKDQRTNDLRFHVWAKKSKNKKEECVIIDYHQANDQGKIKLNELLSKKNNIFSLINNIL